MKNNFLKVDCLWGFNEYRKIVLTEDSIHQGYNKVQKTIQTKIDPKQYSEMSIDFYENRGS